MCDKSYYLAYESRYKKVFEEGVERWGHAPDDEVLREALTKWVADNGLHGKKIIEFACGEGASGVVLSQLGCLYHNFNRIAISFSRGFDVVKEMSMSPIRFAKDTSLPIILSIST